MAPGRRRRAAERHGAVDRRSSRPQARVIAAEPAGADDAYRSMQAGHIIPLRAAEDDRRRSAHLTWPGDLCDHPSACQPDRDRERRAIVAGMRYVWERAKIIIEPSSAVPVGALLEKKFDAQGGAWA